MIHLARWESVQQYCVTEGQKTSVVISFPDGFKWQCHFYTASAIIEQGSFGSKRSVWLLNVVVATPSKIIPKPLLTI